jgi:RNA polymerase sigma-70 factor (ECF subfamily)
MDLPATPRAGRPPSYADLQRLDDAQLMASLQAGCIDVLTVLFDRYHRLIYSITLKILRDPGEAEDVLQNVFLDIFRAMAQFDPAKGTTKGWLLQYAYHRAINRRKYLCARGFYSQVSFEDAAPVLPESDSALGKFAPAELELLLKKGLATLSEPQRRVIELASYEGFTMKEIADKTRESLVNVRHHYYRGLGKLRAFILGASAREKVVE